jgi:hypothetical protein
LGGFHAARCHCDRDFARRAALAGMDIQAMRNDPLLKQALFVKGVNACQITKSSTLGHHSKKRELIRRNLETLRKEGLIKIEPKTVVLKKWQP